MSLTARGVIPTPNPIVKRPTEWDYEKCRKRGHLLHKGSYGDWHCARCGKFDFRRKLKKSYEKIRRECVSCDAIYEVGMKR